MRVEIICFPVLGTQHSVITSIQDETGARIHFVRPQKEKGTMYEVKYSQPRTQALYSTLLPRLRKDPGSGWSRVSQILGDDNCNSLGVG